MELEPQKIGLELSRRLKEYIESIPGALSIVYNGKPFNFKDIDEKRLIIELTVLTYVGQRLAVQLVHKEGYERDISERNEIIDSLDSYSSEFLENSLEFDDLLEQRGEQYFQLVQSHAAGAKADWEKFYNDLEFKFEQFCLGGGGNEGDMIVLGGFTSTMPLNMLAIEYWKMGFVKTVEFLKTHYLM